MKKGIRVQYLGRVQGVGFRFTAQQIANTFGVRGWVRNLRDGSVEIYAEADKEILQKFLGDIRKAFSQYIQEVKSEWVEADSNLDSFIIKF